MDGHKERRRRKKRHIPKEKMRKAYFAMASTIFLFGNLLQWLSLRGFDIIISAGLSLILGFIGWLVGILAVRQVKRHRTALQWDVLSPVGYWGNLIIMLLSLFFFLLLFTQGVMGGKYI